MRATLISSRYYSGPGIVGARRAARWVIDLPGDDAVNIAAAHTRALELVASVTTVRPEEPARIPASQEDLLLCLGLALQHAHYHPVSGGAVRMLSAGCVEVGVEVVKESVVAPLGECLCALFDEAAGLASKGAFERVWRQHREALAFTLTDLFLFDRLRVARRIGVPVWYDGARRQFFGDGRHACQTSPGKTAATSRLGSDLTGDKQRTYRRLAACALPAPRQIAVHDADAAVAAARRIGYPVVLKPRWGKQGRGVTVNLTTEAEVRAAYADAVEFGRSVVVEQYIIGADYRLLVIGGRFVAAVKRVPACLVGDGRRSVQALIDRSNRRDRRDSVFLWPLHVDPEMRGTLASQGLSLDSVPQAGASVRLRRVANQSIGGTTVDVTDEVHPDNRAMAVAVARACQLDLAGLDLVTDDVGRSWRKGNAAIIEVNSGPGIDLHMLPTEGKARDVSWYLIRAAHPARAPGLVPRVMVSGTRRGAVGARIAGLLGRLGFNSGVLDGARFTVGERDVTADSPAQAAEMLFSLPDVDAVVVNQSLSALAEAGSLVERYAVSVLTDADAGEGELQAALHDGAAAERLGALVVWLASVVVVDAGSAALRARVAGLPPAQAGYVWLSETPSADVDAHVGAGGWAVMLARRDGAAWLQWRQRDRVVALLPLTGASDEEEKVRVDAFAAAALIGAGQAPARVAEALRGRALATAPTLAERARGVTVANAWPADELESIFDGAWINRPGPGWRYGEVVLGAEAARSGAVAVIAGSADDLEACAGLEAAVRTAFERGASAVVAPLLPDELPRWHPVLVCDDPEAGHARLCAEPADDVAPAVM